MSGLSSSIEWQERKNTTQSSAEKGCRGSVQKNVEKNIIVSGDCVVVSAVSKHIVERKPVGLSKRT